VGSTATFLDNCYNVTRDFNRDEIDVTAFGDHPFKQSEAGFIDCSINLSMRKGLAADGGFASDVEFMEQHCLEGRPFRIAILDKRNSTTANGFIMTVIATQVGDGGDFSSAQDLTYSLKMAKGRLAPKRVVAGEIMPIDFAELD